MTRTLESASLHATAFGSDACNGGGSGGGSDGGDVTTKVRTVVRCGAPFDGGIRYFGRVWYDGR